MTALSKLRPLAAITALSIVVVVAGCGGGSGSGPSPASEASLRAAQPGELLAQFRTRLSQRAIRTTDVLLVTGATAGVAGSVDGSSTYSGTNLQEAGVDEDDLLKTDGSFIYALHPAYGWGDSKVAARLGASRIQPDGSLDTARSVTFDLQSSPSGMYLIDDAQRIAVIGHKAGQVSLDIYATSGDAPPSHTTQVLMDGHVISSRRIGDVLYLASTWAPDLYRYWQGVPQPAEPADAALAGLGLTDVLPTIRTNGAAAQPLVAEQDCYLQPGDASLSLQLTTITAIDLSTPALERRSMCFFGNGQTLYMSPESVYVASSRNYWLAADFLWNSFPAQSTTDIHKFALNGMQVDYRGSAEVAGHLGWDREKMPYRMSEYQGDLRVVTFTGQEGWFSVAATVSTLADVSTSAAIDAPPPPATPPSPATLTILREDLSAGSLRLATVATLPNAQRPAPLGREGEQVYAVQFTGPLAYVVTFRRVDPLYVLDLSNPADPKAVGELTVPGFSDYLFPLANGKLLGVGKDATSSGLIQGLRISLFDVADPARPTLLSSRNLGERGTSSGLDYTRHGINILQQGTQARIALPVSITEGSDPYASRQGLTRYVVDTAAGTLDERPMVGETRFSGTDYEDRFGRFYLGNERSIQFSNATYYLSGGQVSFTAEP